MAIDEGTENITVTKSDRCTRAEFIVDDQDGVVLIFSRQRTYILGGEVKHRLDLPVTRRALTQIAAQQFVINAQLTITGTQFMQIVNKVGDILRQEDIA